MARWLDGRVEKLFAGCGIAGDLCGIFVDGLCSMEVLEAAAQAFFSTLVLAICRCALLE